MLTLATGMSASAQVTTSSVDLQAARLRYADSVDATAFGIAPQLRLDWTHATLTATGTYARLSPGWSVDGTAIGSLFTPVRRGWSGEVAGIAGGTRRDDGSRNSVAIGSARLHLDGATAGAWIGGGLGTTSSGYASRSLRQGEGGFWTASGPGALTLVAQPTVVDDSIRYTDFSAEGSWRTARLELDAIAGSRAGARLPFITSRVTSWANASAAVWVRPQVAIVASGGTYPVDYTQGFPGGRFVSLGIRLALTRRAVAAPSTPVVVPAPRMVPAAAGVTLLRVTRADRGRRTIRVYAPQARRVEIMGDLTGWKARRLGHAGKGWFTLTIPLRPGSYEVVVRADGGAWAPPPGAPTVRDEFGGASGVLVIE